MKVLGIVCSPRRNGNTEIMVLEALRGAEDYGAETELVTLAERDIKPCDGCLSCEKTGLCHIDDDVQEVYEKMLDADGIIFGTPVYVGSVSAQAPDWISPSLPPQLHAFECITLIGLQCEVQCIIGVRPIFVKRDGDGPRAETTAATGLVAYSGLNPMWMRATQAMPEMRERVP